MNLHDEPISLEGLTLAGRPNCPQCGSIHVAELAYGIPQFVDTPAQLYGYEILCGCNILIGRSTKWRCRACSHDFGLLPYSDEGDKGGVVLPMKG